MRGVIVIALASTGVNESLHVTEFLHNLACVALKPQAVFAAAVGSILGLEVSFKLTVWRVICECSAILHNILARTCVVGRHVFLGLGFVICVCGDKIFFLRNLN
jgi:hypothetical protein